MRCTSTVSLVSDAFDYFKHPLGSFKPDRLYLFVVAAVPVEVAVTLAAIFAVAVVPLEVAVTLVALFVVAVVPIEVAVTLVVLFVVAVVPVEVAVL